MCFGGLSYKGKTVPSMRWGRRAGEPRLVPGDGFSELTQERRSHRIRVGVLRRLPLAPGVATLILVHFICELCVTRIRLGQQAVGEEAAVTKGETLPKVVADHPSYFQWPENIYTPGVAPCSLLGSPLQTPFCTNSF